MELQGHYIVSQFFLSIGTLESRRHDPKIITETIAPQSIIFGFYTFQHFHQLEKPTKKKAEKHSAKSETKDYRLTTPPLGKRVKFGFNTLDNLIFVS